MFRARGDRYIYVLCESVSFHRQIDGLAAVVRRDFGLDPMSGDYFVFRSRSRHSARILYYDGLGYNLLTRRLSSGTIAGWPSGRTYSKLFADELYRLIWS